MSTSLAESINTTSFRYPHELEKYYHEGVINKFRDEWDVEIEEAQEIFSEMKKFIFISAIAQKECIEFEIDEPILIIDKMWHQFILFTMDYERFCNKFFGKMLHHVPFCSTHLVQKIKALSEHGITLNEHKAERLRRQLETIKLTFGKSTLEKWYIDYAHKYSYERMNMLQRPVFFGDLDSLNKPLNISDVKRMGANELINGIVDRGSASLYCGGHGCGMYCTCNSSGGSLYT
ncbi:hypothetical protein [Halomonas caseinilytica]|uniref:hypothetical protein n=1 Tax=Halomonas caseinilytica TaxID=438744 RepID=UPI0008493F4F|nr:hypothetical protein [Halomonas caseinilytica]